MRITDYSQVMINGDLQVELVIGNVPTVTISGPEQDLRKVQVDMDSGTLIVSLTEARLSDSAMRVVLQARRMMKVKATGAARISTPRVLEAPALMVDLAGDATAGLDLNSMRVSVRLNHNASLVMKGSCGVLLGEMKGNSRLEALSVPVLRADLSLDDAAQARVHVTDNLKVKTAGQALLEYRGTPKKVETEGRKESIRRLAEEP
jgi:hypothetical protein